MMFVTPTIAVTPVESFVIDHDFRAVATAARQRCYPHPMGKRRMREHPFEDNPFIDALSRMDGAHPRDNSRSRHSIWCSTPLEHAGRRRQAAQDLVWADGKRLSIEHSTDLHPYRASGRASPPDRNSPAGLARTVLQNPTPNANSK